MKHHSLAISSAIFASSLMITACNGGGGSQPPVIPTAVTPLPTSNGPTWTAGEFLAETEFKNSCATPRTGPDSNGDIFQDQAGTAMHEKMWLRSWTNNTYLWYSEVDDNNPVPFSVADYFTQLKTNERTDSGSLKDNFHFSQSTEEYNELTQSGVSSGYGINWEFGSSVPPRSLTVQYTEPSSPAAIAGIARGMKLKKIGEIDFVNTNSRADIDVINDALFPTGESRTTNFVFSDLSGDEVSIEVTSGNVEVQPVQNVTVLDTAIGKVGYMHFNSHISVAQDGLIDGFQQFVDENVTDLVLDLRYNGGGALLLASQVAYMIAGDAQTNNQVFDETQFNDKHTVTNPVTGNALRPFPFFDKEYNWDTSNFTDNTLPSLNLSRVFILSTGNTCSASESIINGLRGIDVEVVLIGDTTCGKPYGFYPADNCSTTYFSIQLQGQNAKGFGEYSEGFKPMANPQFQDEVTGCLVSDDFTNPLGSKDEALLASAIAYAETGICPVQAKPTLKLKAEAKQGNSGLAIKTPNTMLESIVLENKLLTVIKEPTNK